MPIKKKKPISWVWIVLAFIVFWPVGIVLLVIRLSSDRSATIKCHKTIMVVSLILIGIGAILLIAAIGEADEDLFFPAVAFLIGGIVVNFMARKTKKTGARYKQYIALIVNHSQNSLDAIAGMVGVTYEMVIEDLQKMIKAGYFHGGYIDFTQRIIVFAPSSPQPVWQTNPAVAAPPAPPQIKVVSCGNCGANNRVYTGYSYDCEYCGSPVYAA